MKRIEEIKGRRQAQHIYDRWKKAKEIEKQKDIKEVQRDLALIRSPAAGLKRPQKEMEVEEEDAEEEMESVAVGDTDVKAVSSAKKAKRAKAAKKTVRVVEEIHESDQEMEAY